MNDDTVYFSKKQQNKRDMTKLVVLTVFTVVWLVITIVNNTYLSKKSQSAVSWGNSIIEQNEKILKNQEVNRTALVGQVEKILRNQTMMMEKLTSTDDKLKATDDKLKAVEKSFDKLEKVKKEPSAKSKKQPLLSPKH
jgi:peptidoglycan hydrolase CwlO-like protein